MAAKIEAGEITPNISKVNVSSLVNSVIDAFNIVARKMGIEIETQYNIAHGLVRTSISKPTPKNWKLVLSNLLNNALKYSYKDSKVIVKVWVDDEELFISVQDFGTGISEKPLF